MGKRTAIRTKHAPHFYFIFAAVAILIGIFGTIVYTNVFAQTTEIVYTCVQKVSGNIRVITATDSCKSNETALNWNKEGPAGPQGAPGTSSNSGLPYTCNNCILFPYADKFRGKDFSNAQIQSSEFAGADLTGVNFKQAYLQSVSFMNANVTGADFSNLTKNIIDSAPSGFTYTSQSVNFRNANLTNATFTGSLLPSFDFRNANLQNTDFSNTTIKSSKFQGATNASTANFTGATWENTTCPDGTNSNNNGSTCVGHF